MNYSIKEQLRQKQGKIVWLASYPKSGNTWVRAFLTALFNLNDYSVNNLISDAYFPKRHTFEHLVGIESRHLTAKEINKYRLAYTNYLTKPTQSNRLLFVKIHDKFNSTETAYITPTNTKAIIYIVRNPLSVVASFASHYAISINSAIDAMNNSDFINQPEDIRSNPQSQFPQPLNTWSGNVSSWIDNPIFPVHLVKYEDLANTPFLTFSALVKALGLTVTKDEINHAIRLSNFNNLKKNEQEIGFKEMPSVHNNFFRKGKTDSWKEELSSAQQLKVIEQHKNIMERLGYL